MPEMHQCLFIIVVLFTIFIIVITQKLVLQQSKYVTAKCTETLLPPPCIQFSLLFFLNFNYWIPFEIDKQKEIVNRHICVDFLWIIEFSDQIELCPSLLFSVRHILKSNKKSF